ncbi:universal stress protein [Pontibacter akesuensis]|nr:universal stress protein [Pontibacter akesuensis]GHA71921.1 universal stress protein [Pontibacter akesuensis]
MFKILIPVDFTDNSRNACKYALHLAAPYPEAEILLLHCFSDYLLDPELDDPFADTGRSSLSPASEAITDRVLHRNQEDGHAQLDALYKEIKATGAAPHVLLKRAFVNGMPEDVIPEQVAEYKPDLLVMGTKGEDDYSRSLFGTITTKMVDEAEVPLLTVPGHYRGHGFSRILYATDFSKTDAQAIHSLQELLQPFNAQILCVHIGSDDTEKKDRQQLEQLRESLQGSASTQNIGFKLLEGDDVADALEEFVTQEQVELIAVTNHQRSLLSSILHPSLTKKLVLEVQVPMLVFHSPDKA